MKITNNCIVSIDFKLTDTDGEILDASAEGTPMGSDTAVWDSSMVRRVTCAVSEAGQPGPVAMSDTKRMSLISLSSLR